MKNLLIYHSKTGFTRRYAQWLAQQWPCTLFPFEQARAGAGLAGYDTVVFASWLHAGSIQKLGDFLRWDLGPARRVVLATGASPQGEEQVQRAIAGHEAQICGAFYLPGGLCYERMSLADRCMMRVFKAMMDSKKDKTPDEVQMCAALGASFDHSSPEYLAPVVEYLRGLERG